MNRKLFLGAIIIASATLFGCSKNEPKTDPNAMKYAIDGIVDTKIAHKGTVVLPLAVTRLSGAQENLTLSVSGLPGGAKATFEPASGIPNFATTLTITTNYTDGGTYDLKVTGKTASDSVKSYTMKLTVEPEPALGCVEKLTGSYQSKYEGSFSGTQTDQVVATTTKNYIKFQNMKYMGDFYATIDCDNHLLDIKFQKTSGGAYVMGTGSFDDKNITLQILIRDQNNTTNLGNFNCYMAR
jgi:hypothetical protein